MPGADQDQVLVCLSVMGRPTQQQIYARRKFDPTHHYGTQLYSDEVEVKALGFTFLDCDHASLSCGCTPDGCCACYADYGCFSDQRTIRRPLVVASDAGCRYEPQRIGAIGVFVGKRSPYNVSELMPPADATEPRITSTHAELTAALRALHTVMRIKDDGMLPAVDTLVLKADCKLIMDGMAHRMLGWQENGYVNSSGLPISDRAVFEQLEAATVKLRSHYQVETRFWWVERAYNKKADRLATAAIVREEVRQRRTWKAKDADLHAKRRRGGDETADVAPAKRARVQPPPVPTQWVSVNRPAPNAILQSLLSAAFRERLRELGISSRRPSSLWRALPSRAPVGPPLPLKPLQCIPTPAHTATNATSRRPIMKPTSRPPPKRLQSVATPAQAVTEATLPDPFLRPLFPQVPKATTLAPPTMQTPAVLPTSPVTLSKAADLTTKPQ